MNLKILAYALGFVLAAYWLPFAFSWFVLHVPWWGAALLAFLMLHLIIQIDISQSS